MNNKKYYAIHDVNFCHTLKWLTGEDYYVFINTDGSKSFSFMYTDKLKKALDVAKEMKNKMR